MSADENTYREAITTFFGETLNAGWNLLATPLMALLVGTLVFIISAFGKPAVLVARDTAVWWYIEKYVVNDKLRKLMRSHAYVQKELLLVKLASTILTKEPYTFSDASHSMQPISLDDTQLKKLSIHYLSMYKLMQDTDLIVNKKSARFDLLVKHNSLDSQNNLVDDMLQEELNHAGLDILPDQILEICTPSEIETSISNAMENPLQWLTERKAERIRLEEEFRNSESSQTS